MRAMTCVGAVVGVLALGASSAAASGGPPTPDNCTFSNGITVCATTTTTTTTGTQPAPDYGPGCTQTYTTTTTSTTYTAHKGAPGSHGAAVTAPPGSGTGMTTLGPPICPGS
jgi:hypothetical protein